MPHGFALDLQCIAKRIRKLDKHLCPFLRSSGKDTRIARGLISARIPRQLASVLSSICIEHIMTIIIVWIPKEVVTLPNEAVESIGSEKTSLAPWIHLGHLRVAADSRISRPSMLGSDITTITDSAAKLLSMPVEIYRDRQHGPGCDKIYEGDIGFAFAGTVHPAIFTYSLSALAFRSLRLDYHGALPDFRAFVDYIAKVGAKFVQEIGNGFEAFVIGSSPDQRGLSKTQCFQLQWNPPNLAFDVEELDLAAEGTFGIIGSRKQQISDRIQDGYSKNFEYNPERAIIDEIRSATSPEIGGYLQRAQASNHGFLTLPFWDVDDSPSFRQAMQMHEGGEFGSVGNLRVRSDTENW